MGGRLGFRDPKVFAPLWIVDFPLLEWSEEDGRFYAMHHPFTAPKPEHEKWFYSDKKEDLERVCANAYDFVLNGTELGGGSIRIHNADMQGRMFEVLGIGKEEAEYKFGFIINAFKFGAPPHGGLAFGFDRVCALFGGQETIRDYIAFPKNNQTYSHFCSGLRANGANVLGIADAPWHELSDELRGALTDYYKVNNLEDYGEMYRAVAWFAHKYGKIDWIESNNEYWLEQDARLRTDFNVTTGIKSDHVSAIRNKSEMKKYYAEGGIPTARQIKGSAGQAAVRAFARKTGFPVIAKPDSGMGASGTYKLCSEAELADWFLSHPDNYGAFVIEEFITGLLVSYDAIYNSEGQPIFENNTVFPTPIMEIVHSNSETCYWTNKTVPAKLAAIGRRTVKAFGIKGRFVHLEFFQLDRDREGLGRKGDYVGLEVNMRPPGGYTPDMMDFAHSTDVFKIWADMVVFDKAVKEQGEQFYCAYAGRRDCYTYRHSHEEIMSRYGSNVCMAERVPAALADDLCDMAYIARFKDRKEIEKFFDFVCLK